MDNNILTFTCSRFVAGEVRESLKKMQFLGHDLDWIESDGMFWRDFTVKGNETSLILFKEAWDEYVAEQRRRLAEREEARQPQFPHYEKNEDEFFQAFAVVVVIVVIVILLAMV